MENEFKAALDKARRELGDVEAEERRIAQRKTQLMRSIAALSALCGETPDISAMKLAHAIRAVYTNAYRISPKQGLTPRRVRDELRLLGFNFANFNNELASIHTAIRRMIKVGELRANGDPDIGGYVWVPSSNHAFYGDVPNPYGSTLAEMLTPGWKKSK